MNTTQYEYFLQLDQLHDDASAAEFGRKLRSDGFTAVRRFLDEFRDYLRLFADEASERAAELLYRAQRVLPNPGHVSPSWTDVWKEFDSIIRTKTYVLDSIPASARDGEWQVLLDNPHSNQNIAVYPGLSFMEAIYMFAYFRSDLTLNEYIRLQKIDTVLTFTGADRAGLSD
ncbi:hypothetical protein [Paenibacillus mendelii]|uniref:DUF2313 domain-containing protein n=1 Tax=Paenibacillus mendelii TaxID=206163 RepID=A0ABV6J5L6_9BACL|nr:hypothetical protein [Paenibacillus mendelii]MCQ6560117.1 hypothetical protein [Paenibacillus mendelii]